MNLELPLARTGWIALPVLILAGCSGPQEPPAPAAAPPAAAAPEAVAPAAAADLRLYVIDGGILQASPATYNLTEAEVGSVPLSIAAYLVEHPDGLFLFDTLGIADAERIPDGVGQVQTIIRPDGAERPVTLAPSLTDQLASIGYAPADVTDLAMSHLHWDHTANANLFAAANWYVRPDEHAMMFSDSPGGSARPLLYADLAGSNTIMVEPDEYDVFGDGRVVLKAARGHSPGHQVLYVDLANTGGVVLSGDLYHYPEERSLNRLPVSEYNLEQTRAARADIEEYLARTGAELWIGHDLLAHQALQKAPLYYD